MYLMDHIDDPISAELSDSTDPESKKLYDIMIRKMIHGPCGHYNLKCVCMNEGKCSQEFPKAFCDKTDKNENGYPRYMRRNNGRHFIKEINVVDQFKKISKIELKVINEILL
jgi:hypothetical protein